ncbi:MAG: transglutaminase family protein [Sulfurospirillum sp.]|nr:transglutaminase family protein [Sulfurospirillum sp.]
MIYNIYHETSFNYEGIVSFSHNLARLKPKSNKYQKLLDFSMKVTPHPYEIYDFYDIFHNNTSHMLIREPHEKFTVIGKSKVEILTSTIEEKIATCKTNSITYEAAIKRITLFSPSDLFAKLFLFDSELIPKSSQKIREYAMQSFHPKRDLFEATKEFMTRIYEDFEFVAGFSDVTTPIEKIFEAKQGVCQDFAQFAISALRTIGLPARYMSGYIETIPPKGKQKLFGTDASHAWFSLYIPSIGWVDFDPTNNLIPRDQHILLGYGRDYYDISPLKGVVFSSGESELEVKVDVSRED